MKTLNDNNSEKSNGASTYIHGPLNAATDTHDKQ